MTSADRFFMILPSCLEAARHCGKVILVDSQFLTVSLKNKPGFCTYCEKQKKLTVDHVPPKVLLVKPYPANLLTVPACRDCNESFMKDDEYTRTVIALDVRAAKNSVAKEKLPAVIRSLQRTDAKGFADYLARQSRFSTILGPDGAPMGQTIEVDRGRVNKTGARIMRGLYFTETGKPIPKNARVRLESTAGLTASHPDMQTIARVFQVFPDHRSGATGEAFSYAVAMGDRMSAWVMLLYDYFFWVGTVDEREISEREAGVVPPHP
jgi:hypothetical protein